MKITPVIMAGGNGSRLWPASRKLMPKQFLRLIGTDSMLSETLGRLKGLECNPPIVICNHEHRFIAAEELRKSCFEGAQIILEPQGKNTAPAIALAALVSNPDELLLVLAADHIIQDLGAFHLSVKSAIDPAMKGNLVVFGVVPTAPHTGYGYIKAKSLHDISSVEEFVEKPTKENAEKYVKSKQYFWNSGMFMFQASVYLNELECYRPDILSSCKGSIYASSDDLCFIRPGVEEFLACPEDSVDYAVMEKTTKSVVVPMDAKWSDVGCWASLWELAEKDKNLNVAKGDVISHNTYGCYVDAGKKLVATVGLKDLVIVETKDALLVANRHEVQDIKKIVERLKADNRKEFLHDREVYRPWGKYDSIDFGCRDQVKRITVKPGAKLSLQMHHHRAEHWIVVSGTAKVTVGEETKLISENESTYIPIGSIHCLENPGKISLEMIEVQTGSYLGEDDIVRFEDMYGRT